MRRRKIQLGDKTVEALELDFEVKTEQWSEYQLLDGGIVRMKTTPLRICRVLDENGNPAVTAEGDPHLLVNHNTQVVVKE